MSGADLKAVLSWIVENKELIVAVATVAVAVWFKVRELAAKSGAQIMAEGIEAMDTIIRESQAIDQLFDEHGKPIIKGLITEKRLAEGGPGSRFIERLVKKF